MKCTLLLTKMSKEIEIDTTSKKKNIYESLHSILNNLNLMDFVTDLQNNEDNTIDENSLIAKYDFQNINSEILYDLSGNNYNGIINGPSWNTEEYNQNDLCCNDPENDADGDGVCESDEIFGCTDENACTYNDLATEENESCSYCFEDDCENYPQDFYDCTGECMDLGCTMQCDGSYFNECGACVEGITGNLSDFGIDCFGECWGEAEIDECGICDGDSQSCADCAGVPNGDAFIDICDECVGGTTELDECVEDCNDVWGGTAIINDCWICVGGNTGLAEDFQMDCDGVCYGSNHAEDGYDCDGNCLNDLDNDSICDENDACPNDPENDADGDGLCCFNSVSNGNELYFDGDNDYVNSGNAIFDYLNNNFTYELYVKPDKEIDIPAVPHIPPYNYSGGNQNYIVFPELIGNGTGLSIGTN